MLHDLDFRVLGNHRYLIVRKTFVLLGRYIDLFFPPGFDVSVLLHQSIGEPHIRSPEPLVLLGQDVIGVIRLLLGSFYILLASRVKADNLIPRSEDPHHRWFYPLDRIRNVSTDYLAPTLHFITERLAKVVVEG